MAGAVNQPLRVRGHHLLCLLGYRGFGYSDAHVARMWEVKRQLWSHPETEVEVLDSPDEVCLLCPYIKDGGCAIQAGDEARVRKRDRGALALLGLRPGRRLTWGEVLGRIRQRVDEVGLARVCGRCQWFSHGHCLEGLREVRLQDV